MGQVSRVGRKVVVRLKSIEVTRNPVAKALMWPPKEFRLHPENHQKHCGVLTKVML